MGCRIIEGYEAGSRFDRCCLYDSVTGWCFGPTFGSVEEATAFIRFCEPRDPRSIPLDELDSLESAFNGRTVVVICDDCGIEFTTFGHLIDEHNREATCPCGAIVCVPPESEVVEREAAVSA